MSMRRAALLSFGLLALACGDDAPPAPPPLPDASRVALDDVDGPVEGQVDGRAFRALDARFRVVTFPGRERVDLFFADRAIARCGLSVARDETRVWLRMPGVTSIALGELALLAAPEADAPASFEIHYERPIAGGYAEAHRGVARLEITSASAAQVDGRMRVCFAGADDSCVGGAFHATPCQSRIDGRALREPPGLADEALEPVRMPAPADEAVR